MLPFDKRLKKYSRELRNNMTETESFLWSKLKGRQLSGFRFYRQKIIGSYIVDFYCPALRLVLELDGGGHSTIEGANNDKIRDGFLVGLGLKVLRFSDRDVLTNVDGVIEKILETAS